MAKQHKINEKNVILSVTDDGSFNMQGFEGEELKGESDLTKELIKFSEEKIPVNISIKHYKAKGEPKPKAPKFCYECECSSFESKLDFLEIHCKKCDTDFECGKIEG